MPDAIPPLTVLVEQVQALACAQALAAKRGQPDVAALLLEMQRLTEERLLLGYPQYAHRTAGTVTVRGIGALDALPHPGRSTRP